MPSPDRVTAYIEIALEGRARHGDLPFAVRHRESGRVIGSTRFFRADPDNRRLELGHTWYARRFQRSAVNSECKLLLLGHAFERLEAIAVELRTHWHNHASRNAIARLGAKQDGVLRHHTVSADGIYREQVFHQPGAGGAPESQPAAGSPLVHAHLSPAPAAWARRANAELVVPIQVSNTDHGAGGGPEAVRRDWRCVSGKGPPRRRYAP